MHIGQTKRCSDIAFKKSTFSKKDIKVVPVPEEFKGIKHDTSEVTIPLIHVLFVWSPLSFSCNRNTLNSKMRKLDFKI